MVRNFLFFFVNNLFPNKSWKQQKNSLTQPLHYFFENGDYVFGTVQYIF